MEEQEDEEEKERPDYFYRLICLVVELGTKVLLKLFSKDIPQSQTVKEFLNSKANVKVLKSLKNKKVFNELQLEIINAASPDVSRFDISLLYILISNLNNIQSPTGGWFIKCPIPSDQSAGALLMNLRRVRNEAIAHSAKGKMKKSDFEKNWNEAKDILIELAGEVSHAEKESVKEEIDKTKVKQLVGDMGNKLEALLLWAEQDRNCEKMLSILGDVSKKNDQQSKVLEDIKSNIRANTDQLKTLTDQIRQIPGTSSGTEVQQSKMLEDIKTHIQTMTDQNRPIPGTSSGTESSLPVMIYNRPKKRVSWKPVAKKTKSGAKRLKKSQEDNKKVAPDLEDSKYFTTKTKLRTEIMDHYKETGCSTTTVPAQMDGEEVHIDEIFVMPSMRVRANMATGRDSVTQFTRNKNKDVKTGGISTIHELFQKDGKSIRRICISGDAGQGKTTLCKKIVSSWCTVHAHIKTVPDTEHQFLKSFDLLFYLPLRNNKLSDVIEIIKNDIVRKASHNALKEFLEKESEKCLIILDGLDEWLPSDDCKHNVPYIDPKEKFTVLITSRPWKLEVLRPTMSEIGQEVELKGVENVKLIEAVVNFLNNKYAKERNWEDFKYNEVNHLAESPIILTHMVCMWYDDEACGNTRVEHHSKMVDYLFHVADKRHQKILDSAWMRPLRSTNTLLVNVFKDFKYCDMYSEILFKLSDLAYHTLFNEKRENSLVFPHSVTEIYELAENDVKFCLFVGILSQTKSLCKASSHTKSISFLHKTFQEFLAALYIAYGGKDSIVTLSLQTLKDLDDVFEMSQVLIFLSGLRPDLLGDMSRHLAQLTDKDERVLQYRSSIRSKHRHIIARLKDIVYNCIVEVPEHSIFDNTVELRDVNIYNAEIMIPYLNLENVKSWYQVLDVPSEDWTKSNDLVRLDICIKSQKDVDNVTSIVERFASSLTCLSVDTPIFKNCTLINIDHFLTALKKVSHLTSVNLGNECYLGHVHLTHSDIEYLGTTFSQSTQLKEIRLGAIRCRTCQKGHCNYRIDLSHHKQLQYLAISCLDGDIVLSNEVPIEHCQIRYVKSDVSILDKLKSSTNLHRLDVEHGDLDLYHTNSVTSSTTTVQDDESEVHPTTLCFSKVLTDVIPTLKNLRRLHLCYINFKQDILRLSPVMTRLECVSITDTKMTLQCLQGLIDSLPQTKDNVHMWYIYICPEEDTSTALKYITDSLQLTSEDPCGITVDGCLYFDIYQRPSH